MRGETAHAGDSLFFSQERCTDRETGFSGWIKPGGREGGKGPGWRWHPKCKRKGSQGKPNAASAAMFRNPSGRICPCHTNSAFPSPAGAPKSIWIWNPPLSASFPSMGIRSPPKNGPARPRSCSPPPRSTVTARRWTRRSKPAAPSTAASKARPRCAPARTTRAGAA